MFEQTLENTWTTILHRLLPDASYTLSELEEDETKTWYERLVVENKPTLEAFEVEFQVYLDELEAIEQARLAEIARIEDLKARWFALGDYKRECYNELGYAHVPNLEAEFFIPQILNADQEQAELVLSAFENKKIELEAIKAQFAYIALRVKEYPSINEFADGFAKSKSSDPVLAAEGIAQMEKYAQDCLAVKAKYPKGV